MLNLLKKYGFYGSVRIATDLLVSKLMFPSASLIRRPFYIRTEGQLGLGKGFLSGPGLIMDVLSVNASLEIGTGVMVNHHVHIAAADSVKIGARTLIASGVYISDHGHGQYSGEGEHSSPLLPPNERPLITKPVIIGEDCWLGERVAVLPGVTIGKGVTVGAGAVVTCDIPEYSIAAGIPAKVIKTYDFELKQWVSVRR